MSKVKYIYICTLNDKPVFYVNDRQKAIDWLENVSCNSFEVDSYDEVKSATNENGVYSYHAVPPMRYANHY